MVGKKPFFSPAVSMAVSVVTPLTDSLFPTEYTIIDMSTCESSHVWHTNISFISIKCGTLHYGFLRARKQMNKMISHCQLNRTDCCVSHLMINLVTK